MERKLQTESGALRLNGTTKNSRFEMKLRAKINGALSWLWEWQQALHHNYCQSKLKARFAYWSTTHAPPTLALAYVHVKDVTIRGEPRK